MADVRARTLNRMQHLMKAAAGVAVVSAAACPGYMVVDPVPPPSRCAGTPPDIKASGTLLENVDGGFEVFVLLERSAKPVSYVDKAPTIEGGSVIFWRVTSTGFELRVKLPPEAITKQPGFATPPPSSIEGPAPPSTAPTHRLAITLPLVCSDGPGNLSATIDIRTDARTGENLQVNLASSY